MHFRTDPAFGFVVVFAFVLSILAGVHLIANDALAMLLPGDGCGQIVDPELQFQIKSGLALAYVICCFVSISFAAIVAFGRGTKMLHLSAFACMVTFLVAGAIHLRHSEHLNFCDMFFMGRDAPYLNFGAAGFLVLISALTFYHAKTKPE